LVVVAARVVVAVEALAPLLALPAAMVARLVAEAVAEVRPLQLLAQVVRVVRVVS
jgi:hypothetical protein